MSFVSSTFPENLCNRPTRHLQEYSSVVRLLTHTLVGYVEHTLLSVIDFRFPTPVGRRLNRGRSREWLNGSLLPEPTCFGILCKRSTVS